VPPRSVLLVEPWYGGSHRAWADGLVAASRHRFHLVTHDAAFWRWRMRGSAVTLAARTEQVVAAHGPPDVVIVSDMVDLAAYLGLTRRVLGDPPVVLYLHENQLVHAPSTSGEADSLYATINWTGLVAADQVWCNSAFHRDELVGALPAFLAGAPDHRHADLLDAVVAKLGVVPVGVDLEGLLGPCPRAETPTEEPPLVLWNQRWDHDKDPAALLRVLVALARDGVPFHVALAGANQRSDPQEFDDAIRVLGDRVVHTGWLPRDDYPALLRRADVVVSTARHELFGIAMIEAMAAGAVPLLPHRQSYPEIVPVEHHDAVLYPSRLYDHLSAVLRDLPAARSRVAGLAASMARWSWPAVIGRYDDAIDALAP